MEDTEKADSEPIPTNDEASNVQGKSCALCGCATPAVRCDRCNSQMFCLSCDDMYHRHPKRKLHLRKAVDSIWSSARSPRLRRRTDLPGDPCKIPIPPPRTKKRERHTISGRMFLKSGLELGSFGHSKVFDPKNLPSSRDFFIGQKSPASMGESNCDDDSSLKNQSGQIYENDNIGNTDRNLDGNFPDRSPWNTRPNISSPIQVSIPSNSPDIVANGQSFGYPTKPHSQSAADLSGHAGHPAGPHPYHFHPPYPYMHPSMHPYSHSMAHLNCAQCISSSWSNLMSPHPSPYFHPMPWGSAQNTMSRGQPIPGHPGPMKHSHGDLVTYPDSNFHYPYPGGGYYHNGPPIVDPNFIKDLHEQAEMQKQMKETVGSKPSPKNEEEMDTSTMNPGSEETEPSSASNVVASTVAYASAKRDVREVDEEPPVPEKPTEPWTCAHCTYINPPGNYICEVCCKTSYGNKPPKESEDQGEMRPMSRDSESPLINRDALLNSPEYSGFKEVQKVDDVQLSETDVRDQSISRASNISEASAKFTTETQTLTTTKTTDAQTQNIQLKSIALSTDSIFLKQEISVQTEVEAAAPQNCSVATDPMISSQSLESLLSGVSAPPYHNRRAGWGRGATSFSTQSLYERGRSRSPMTRSLSFYNEPHTFGRSSNFASEEAMHSASQAWLYTDPMYYKPHNQELGHSLTKEDYFDGTWGSMDKLNQRVKQKKDKGKVDHIQPKFHRSLDDLKAEKRPEIIHAPELLMLQTVKEAERCGFSLEDLHVAYLNCGKQNPVYWLEDNWSSMIKNVVALAAKYGEDNEENDVGPLTTTEAKDALRIHRGDLWDAVTECIENRQRKILELTVRGNFTQKQIAEALKNNEGNVELAYADLVRASTRRHKFILSPGLSEDSEDLNIYNPTEDSTVDHHLSPLKAPKLDTSADSKTEKKRSDFFTKLTSIRQAQSERRKAREEKELIRETITQDFPTSVESEAALKDKAMTQLSMSRDDSKEVDDIIPDGLPQSEAETEIKTEEVPTLENVVNIKESTEDNVPVDFDTNWSESQGEWIEEYSDEQWEGDDEHWVGLGKKFQKMEKEFEEEARQMASLWEKEELEDDVFEDDAKIQPEADVIADSDKKFDDWVKANLKVDSSEYEEEEMKGKYLGEDIPPVSPISLKERIELEVSGSSPLQHYPTEHDLSLKSQYESDWVDLPADEEIEKLAHDIVCEGSDIENKFDEADVLSYEEEKKPMKFSDQGSDEDWEKIEMEEQLQEVNELDRFAFPEKEGEIDTNFEELTEGATESQITIARDSKVLYKNLEITTTAGDSDARETITDLIEQTADQISKSYTIEKLPSDEGDLPMPPVRRKSKLNSAAIEQALKNQAMTQISADIPPPLPEKAKHKDSELQKMTDIYALPDKTSKLSQEETESKVEIFPTVPQKPPRLNLSTLSPAESALQLSREEENEPEVPSKTMLSKEASPLSLSYESDSNCFADSESDIEIKLHRQKNKVRKLAKYENEFEDTELESVSWQKREKLALEEKEDVLESNFDIELDDDIDPALIEPLPRMKDFDFDPELPIMLGGRGSRISDIEDVDAPKAFREDTGRPLQLFKAVKRETPTNTLSRTPASSFELQEFETSILRTNEGKPLMVGPPVGSDLSANKNANIQMQPFEASPSQLQSTVYENQLVESYYYNEAMVPEQNLITNQILDSQTSVDQIQVVEELKNQLNQEIVPSEQEIQSVLPIQEQDEMTTTEMGSSFAAADYFYGRYDEITVTHPKKKTSVKAKTTITDTLSTDTKAMSVSEISPVAKPYTPSQMDQSATAVLQVTNTVSSTSNDQMLLPPVKNKEPVPSEPLPFAEDYLFGAYQVTIPRKTKSRPVVLATIPKLEDLRAQSTRKEQKPSASTTMPAPIATPEPPEEPTEEPTEEEPEEQVSEEEENAIIADTSSIYDEIFHDLPPEILSNQSFDESSIYESFQDAVEDVQGSIITSSVVNVRPKSVHFEEPGAPAVPPRRNKSQGGPKTKAAASTASNESYADEYLFRQYEQVTQATQAKKKLPVGSEDFRMQQGFEPTDFPCDSPLMSNEQDEDAMSSEISADIPSKSIKSPKYCSEYDFGDSEQHLGSIMPEEAIKAAMEAVKSSIPCSEDSSVSIEKVSEIISPGTGLESLTGTDLLTCEKAESFEELSIPDQPDEVMENSHISNDFSVLEECKIVSGDMPSTVTESQFNNMQSSQTSDIKSYDPSVSSEMEQFVFIERTQEIIDDSYDLYDIQESLDLNYIDIKGNIEDECTDDSEQEWKRNEDRKNYLNATFLKSGPSKKIIEEKQTVQEESTLSEFGKSSLEESGDHLPSIDKLKPEESHETQEKNRYVTDKSYLENLKVEKLKETITEEFATANIDDHMVEVLDIESMKSVSGAVKTSDCEQKDSVEIEYKSAESTEKILLEQNETSLQAVAESVRQEIPESFDQDVAESIDQEVPKSIEQDIAESIDQEIPESLEQEIAESIDQEIAESIDQEVPEFIEQDIAESINEMPGESIDELIEAINQEITYVDDEFTESAFEPLSEECLEISEDFNLISSISESSSLLSMQEDYIKAEIEEVGSTEEDLDVSDDQQLGILEELETSGELSDDNASSHSSVSTQIAVSMTQGLKEIEGDESSLIFEQSDNLESDYEASTAVSFSSSIISSKVLNDEEGFSDHIPKEESFEKLEEISETTVLKDIECEDSFKIDVFDSAEVRPPSPSIDKHQIERFSLEIDINESATTTEDISKVFRESYLEESILTSDEQMGIVKISEKTEIETEDIPQTSFDENIDQSLSESLDINKKYDIEQKIISKGYTGEILMQNVDVSTDQNIIVKVENIESADGSVQVDKKEAELESAEIDSESMEEEECSLPIMSHFYDDLYQASSIQFSHLSIESIYAKYGTAESSESGNESDVDNALNNLSEDISQAILISQKENLIDHSIPEDQFKEKDPEELDYLVEISLHKELLDGAELDDTTDICDIPKADYTHPLENVPQVKSIDELSSENMQEILHETLDREICFGTEISSFQKGAETLSVYKESDESVEYVKDLEGSDIKTTKNKFSTSKSCQTEDSFEEDIFFDSFDDTFTIPSYINLPIEDNLAKPQTSEISIQCELISIEDILASKNILTRVTQTETTASESQAIRSLPDSMEEPKLSEEEFKQVTSPYEEKDESSCESFEDSDSDIFIESPSSHDEFEPSTKKGYLYAEVDSDTGFSSGSEYGWTRKKDLKQKDLKKTSEIKVVTEVQSQQISTTTSKTIRETSADSIEVDSKTVAIKISEKSDIKSEKKSSDTSQSEGRAPALPIEIIERAITPVAIPQVPFLEEDLVFVEIEENIETEENDKISEEKQKEVISAIPTVEYFYGSLPETVVVESLPDVNDKFFETASELSESISLTHDRTESFSDSVSSIPLLDQMPRMLGITSKELLSSEAKILKEDETFASSKSEINDSISEYYPLSESSISLATRASQAESDIFDLAQSEISDASWRESLADSSAYEDNLNGFTVAPIHLPTDEKKEDKNNSAENLQLSASDIEKDIASDSKGNLTDSDLKALCAKIQNKIEASDEVFSIESHKTLPKDKVLESVERKQLADSEPHISEKDSKSDEESIPGVAYEPEISDITKPFSDVPPAPSDIVRYLYYDDSITFDDESYHSQTENLESPSLPAEEMNIESSADKSFENQLVKQDICKEKPVEELASHVEKFSTAVPEHVTLTETNMIFELDQKNREILDKRSLESQMVPEPTSFPTDTSFVAIIENISADVSKVPTFEEVHEPELPALNDVTVPETDLKLSVLEELSTSKDVDIAPETDVKFPTVEVIASENVIDLPVAAEQTQEPVVHIGEQLPESITAINIPPVHVSILKENTDSQNIESINTKPISLDVPSVPSDIVRYLYYGDDITFDDASQSSFLSQSDSHTSGMPSEDLQPQLDIDKISDDSAPGIKQELLQELSQDLIKDSSHLLGEEFLVAKPDSGSVTDDLGLSFDSSEYIDNWFDMEEGRSTPSINGKKDRDSEQQSSTKSSVLKDSEQPCIPEYILSPIESNLPVGKIDIDEVTDISTHFTMTDDSDRFSDIESDTSLNFEEECMLPLEITHQIEIMDLKDDQMFVSCIEDDEINLRTPEVKDIPGGFQFIPAEPVDEEFTKSLVSAESIGLKEKFDECVASTEFSEQHSIEQFAECLTSSELLYQLPPKSNQEHIVDFSQKLDECSISAEFSKLSKGNFISSKILDEDSDKKNIYEHLEEELKEKFDECATPAEFSELSKEQFSECLTASEIFDQQLKKESVLCETVLEHSIKEQSDGVSASGEQFFLEDENGNFPEFYSDPEVSVTSTNGEILVACTNAEVPVTFTDAEVPVSSTDADIPVTSIDIEAPVTDPEIPVASTDAEVAVVSTDTEVLVTSTHAEILVLSEEAEPLGISPDVEGPIIDPNTKCPIAFDALGKLLQTETVETAFDKRDEMDISHYSLPEEDSHSAECSFVIAESDKHIICPEEHELTLDSKAVKTTIVDKKDDIDKFYGLPDDDSPSMSTDNWSDADAVNIADESIYEVPLEDLNNICTDIYINNVAEEPKELLVDASVTESFDIREKEVIESKGSDIIISEDQKAKIDIEGGENAKIKATESKHTATTEDTRNKFATETEKSEISSTDDTLYTCHISQTKEISVYEEPHPVTRETAFDKQCEILTQISASDSDSKQSSPTSLSSDMKNISDVKMETESEISTTLREEVNIEFMSVTLDSEPTSSVSEAFYDTRVVKFEAISSEELCLDEKVTADVSPQPDVDDNSKVKIATDATMENFQLVDEADIFQSPPLNVIKIKDVEISKVEDEYESDLKISGLIEDDKEKIKEILHVDEKKEQTTLSVSCDRTELSELQLTKEEFEIQTVVLPEEESSVIKDSEILPLDVQKLRLIKEDFQKVSETEVIEIVDFKGGISAHSAEIIRTNLDEIEDTLLNKSLVHESKVGKSDVVDFSSLKVLLPETGEVTETVDFKGDIEKIKDHASIQMTESTADIKEKAESKETNQEKFICGSDSNICEKVDFKGEFMISDDIVDFKSIETLSSSIDSDSVTNINKKDGKIKTNKHSLEIVDFKGQPVSSSITPEHVIKNEVVDFEATDSMIGKLDRADSTNLKIKNHFETADFKGQLTVSDSISEMNEDATMSVKDIKIENFRTHMKKDDASRQSLELVDFKGQLGSNTEPISETITTEMSTDLMKEKLYIDQDVNKKIEDDLETVDFKGQLTASIFEDISKIKIDGVAVDSKEIKFDLSEKSVADTKESIEKKMAKVDIKSEITVDTVYETVDFKGVLPLNTKELQQEKISSDQTDVNSEIIKTKVCEELIAEENLPDTTTYIESVSLSYSGIEEPEIRTIEGTSIEHDVFDAALHDLSNSELYCYDSYEQALTYDSPEIYVYDIRDQAVIFESQEQTFHNQIMISDISSYGITEESSELLSLEETLSAAEDTSGQFYSLTEDLEGSLIISTSDEFTDVQSQITESSDKWSDAEGDFSFEDAEFDRDKTPIRTSDEGMSVYSEEKEEFKDVTFDVQETESKIKSAVKKDEISTVLDSDKAITGVKVFESSDVTELIELTEKPSEFQAICEQISVEKPPETGSIEDIVSPDKERAILPQSDEEYESFTAEKSSDLSLVSITEDFTSVSTHQITTEGSENWSDVESDIEHLEKEARIVLSDDIVSSTKISDQVISSDALNLSLEYSRTDIQEEKCDTEEQLFEHFADIKSIKEQLTTADSFSSLDAETAISKTHEDASTDISSQFEKTESEYWLEAETEQSTSEFDEDLFSSERDDERQLEMTDNKRVIEEIVTAIPLSQIHSSEAATTTSTSSSYTDLENSDLTSDTCADISLQGYATENSDRWSDIEAEAEALIDDVLYKHIDITENVEIPDFPQLINTADDFKDIAETPIPSSQLQIIQPFPETVTEISALSDAELKSKTETDGTANSESKSKLFESSKSVGSFENADSTSVNLTGTDSGLTSIPTDIPSLLSTPSSMTTIGVSDDELTNVTPLDVTAEESDKWSEISGDTSIEEFEEESSASLKADIKLQDKESDLMSGEVSINFNKKQETVVEDSQKFDLEIKISEADSSVKETVTLVSATDQDEKYDIAETKFSLKGKDKIEELSQSIIQTESYEQTSDDVCKAIPESSVKLETQIEIELEKSKETIQSCIEEKVEVEDYLSSKINDDSETLDNFTDVPTHTLTSEISEAYCEFESDHSVEELENHHIEEDIDTQYIQSAADITSQYSPESYEDSLANEGLLENAEDFALDSIPENELENYEEDEYSLSDHFEINEDELIYPLPYNDWIEQSFELKEYGVEAVFSESGSDIHGLGIACEEYDDEDIQRAIDYNLSTFEENEENIENVGTTDSFKTMSNDASPHLKLSEKEFDTWSTADAPSIEEEFEEHDDILSKIDELLAEDFGLDIYPDSPQEDLTVDIEGYLQRDGLLPDETHEDFTRIDNNRLPEDTLLLIDKGPEIADSETTSCEVLKDFTRIDNNRLPEDKLLLIDKDPKIADSETTSCEVMKSSIVLSETVSSEVIVKDLSDSQTDKKIKISELEPVPGEVTLETSFVKIDKKFKTTDSDIVSSEVSLQKDSKASDLSVSEESNLLSKSAKETAEGNKVAEVLSSHPKTEEELRSKSEIDSSEVVFKKDSTEVFKTESVSSLNKESALRMKSTKEITVESTFSEITSSKSICDKDFEKLDSETLSSEMKLKENSTQMSETKLSSVSKESIPVQETTKIIPQETKVSEISPDQSRTLTPDSWMKIKQSESTATITDESKSLKQRAVATTFDETTDTIIHSDELKKETEADQIISDKSRKNSDDETEASFKSMQISSVEAEALVKSKLVSGAEAEVSVEDKQISSVESDASVKNKEISGAETGVSVKGKQISGVEVESSLKNKPTSSIEAETSVRTQQISGTDAEVVVESKQISGVEAEAPVKSKQILSAEAEVSIKGKQVSGEETESSLKIKQISSVEKEASVSCKQISGVEGESALKIKQVSDADTELSVKLKSSQDSLTTSEDTSASLKLSLSDSGKQINDVSKDSSTFSTSESDSSFDIPSKKLAKSIETSEKVSIKFETSTDLSEVSESTHSSQQLSKSSKHSAVTAADSAEIKSNIPDLQVSKDEKHDEPPVSVTHKRSLPKELVAAESVVAEVKPDIPKKIRQRSFDSKEKTPVKDESDKKPSLPPKTSKRRSISDFPSSSFGESLSSSSESLGSFESAPSGRSRKNSLKSSEEASMHSMSPEVPVRRSRASRSSMSTSSRSSSKDSDNSSAPSRSSSLKIRRRSSNFRDSEPIDLSKKRASIDDRMQKLQNEGKCTTKEKAFIAAKLIEMQFEEEDALLASRQCNTVYNAVKFLTQLCEMCNCRFPINLMASMVQCAHRACKECLRAHFTSLIHDRSVFTLLCPMCQTSDITDQNIQEYFIHLDMTLKNILEERVYDLFQRKLRDEVLNKDPNFHWCSQCSSGFIASPRLKKLYCPDCSAITCALCHQTWELEHEGVHCERFQQWKDMHTPEPPPAGLVKYLTDRGVSCPSCGIVYAQACAGCLMYKCSHCSFEFCGFCTQPQKRGRDCSSKICELRGIHIHHVQNCLFFIRDKDITEIQILLEEESVSYLTIPPKDQIVKSRCQVREQKNAHGNLTEDRCGRDIEPYCAGLCRTHYYEYLAEILRKNNVSPLSIMTIQDLQFMLRKSRILVPEKVKGETSEEYYERLLNLVSSTLT